MREVELKFQVPPDRLPAVRRAVATARSVRGELHATYHDTADRALAAAAVALRVRREGGRWVQTAKAPGADAMSRLEHEVDRGPARGATPPAPDLALHAPHPALHARLGQAIGAAAAPLQPLYGTAITRTRRVVRHQGARIELALDEGEIVAGGAALPVAEVEFELLAGPPDALLDLARRWVDRHGLWLDLRSKAHRGDRLARGLAEVPAVKAVPVTLEAAMPPAQALAVGVQAALEQVAGNACELADAAGPRPDCVHQLRVGLRRLRVLLKVFGRAWEGLPMDAGALGAGAADAFRALGGRRDHDVIAALLAGPLHTAGYPLPRLPGDDGDAGDAGTLVRGAAFNRWLLDVLAAGAVATRPQPVATGTAPDEAQPPADGALREQATRALRRLFKRLARDAKTFHTMEPSEQHDVRKRAKQLRYSLDFAASLFPARRVRRFQQRLADLQEVLGLYTDVLTGEDLMRRGDPAHAATAFARGWLAGRREAALAACRQPLRRLAKAEPPWA